MVQSYNKADLASPSSRGVDGIQAGLSTHILIKVSNKIVGAIQSLAPSETRALTRIKEVGTDGYLEIVPTGPADISIEVERLLFDYQHLPEAFSRGFAHIQSQRLPFNIEVHQEDGTSDGKTIVTTYQNCWMTSFSSSYTAGDYLITERATIWAESVKSDTAVPHNASNASTVVKDPIEQWVDSGVGPGAMSVPPIAIS